MGDDEIKKQVAEWRLTFRKMQAEIEVHKSKLGVIQSQCEHRELNTHTDYSGVTESTCKVCGKTVY